MEVKMSIDRKKVVSRNNPILKGIDTASPLTVGNGEFAFTADITGLQSLYHDYADSVPLCTMSQWGWHTEPVSRERHEYTLDDLVMTNYGYNGRQVKYPVERFAGNERTYDWLRQNPHRLNLGRIGLVLGGGEICKDDITDVVQELKLYEGRLESRFRLKGANCLVETCCDPGRDCLAVRIRSELLKDGLLAVRLAFPYGSHDITASDWQKGERHSTEAIDSSGHKLTIKRTVDRDGYFVDIGNAYPVAFKLGAHQVTIQTDREELWFYVEFCAEFSIEFSADVSRRELTAQNIFTGSAAYWRKFWETGGIADFGQCTDMRAPELERRIILSQYLLAVNSMGSMPPQETGLTCNSWYGKMHLEMYFWHCAWAPLWNRPGLLKRSLPWYMGRLGAARENAARNGYRGARWPKMVAREGIDCPSMIAPLLVWQQPHIIMMLELMRRQGLGRDFMEKYFILIEETADFMADFVVYNEAEKVYEMMGPIIPVQECHEPTETKNPAFELEYWRYGLKVALEWENGLGKNHHPHWAEVAGKMAGLPVENGLYLAHEWCPATFGRFNKDHPSMLMTYGVLAGGIEEKIMADTLREVMECWQYETLWGWDFAVMAMTAARLGLPETAVELLLKETSKNEYVASGNNRQSARSDLPLYLPGNGSLLLSAALMIAGYDGSRGDLPGFPKDGKWDIKYENISKYI
jgi:hypothetical protein